MFISSVNYATGNVNDLIENITTLPSNGNNVVNNNVNTNNNVQNITPIGGTNTNTNRNTTTNSVLPQTGVNDNNAMGFYRNKCCSSYNTHIKKLEI